MSVLQALPGRNSNGKHIYAAMQDLMVDASAETSGSHSELLLLLSFKVVGLARDGEYGRVVERNPPLKDFSLSFHFLARLTISQKLSISPQSKGILPSPCTLSSPQGKISELP